MIQQTGPMRAHERGEEAAVSPKAADPVSVLDVGAGMAAVGRAAVEAGRLVLGAAAWAGTFFDLSPFVLNPLGVKVGSTVQLHYPEIGGTFTVERISSVDVDLKTSASRYTDYLLHRDGSGEPQFLRARVAPNADNSVKSVHLFELMGRGSYSFEREDRADEPSGIYKTADGTEYARVGSDADGYICNTYELNDRDGNGKAERWEAGDRRLRAWTFARILPEIAGDPLSGGAELWVIEDDCSGFSEEWRGKAIRPDWLEKL